MTRGPAEPLGTSGHVRLTEGVTLASSLLVGAALRLYQIRRQIVADDEWHALQTLIYNTYGYVASHFGLADYSIALAMFYKLALDTIGLSEMVMRAPVLLFGLASLVVFPLLVWDLVGRSAAAIFVLLLALSPVHVYFSRLARPYSATVFCGFVAAVAFYRWWSGGRRRWATTYVLAAGIGAYFHLTAVPVALAPLAFAALARFTMHRGPKPSELLRVAAAMACLVAALLGLPFWIDYTSLAAKQGTARIDSQTVLGVAQLLGGTREGWLLWLLFVAVIGGAFVIRRTNVSLLLYALTVTVAHTGVILIAQPARAEVPIVLTRYLLPVFPWLLLLASTGLAAAVEWAGRRTAALGLFLVVVTGVTSWARGPLPRVYYRPNNWTNHALFQYAYDAGNAHTLSYHRAPGHISSFYRQLANEPPASLTLLEAPWYLDWSSNVFPFYQRVHRQWMMIGFVREEESDPSQPLFNELRPAHTKDFRHFVHVGDQSGIAARGIDYVIFHKDAPSELPNVMQRPRASVSTWIDQYRTLYGSPVYKDALVVVFDVRRRRHAAVGGVTAE